MKCLKNAKKTGKNTGKRVLSLLLVTAMLFLCFPAAVFADEANEADEPNATNAVSDAAKSEHTEQPVGEPDVGSTDSESEPTAAATTPPTDATRPETSAEQTPTTAAAGSTTEKTAETTEASAKSTTASTEAAAPTTAAAESTTNGGTQPTEAAKNAPTEDEPPLMRAIAKAPMKNATSKKVVIQYLFVTQGPIDEEHMPTEETPDNEIDYPARPVTYEVESGKKFNANVKFPSKAGYTTYYTDVTEPWNPVGRWNTSTLTPDNKLVFEDVTVTQDTTYYVIYAPTEVTYTVKLMQQNVTGDGYTFYDKIARTATLGESVSVIDCSDQNMSGFTQIDYTSTSDSAAFEPSADGSTTVEVRFNRNTHDLTFDCNGGSGMDNVTGARYGAEIVVSTPTRNGYIFKGWTVSSTTPSVTDATVTNALATDANNGRVTVPDFNVTFKAQWEAEATVSAKYTVIYYVQSPVEGDDGTYLEHTQQTFTANAGSEVTVSNIKLPSGDALYNYVTFNSILSGGNSVKKTIAADGSTVFKRYFDRNRYTLTFDIVGSLLSSLTYSPMPKLTVGDSSYTTTYPFTRKYGADISEIWPEKFNNPATRLFTHKFKWLERTSGNVAIYSNPMRLTSELIADTKANSTTEYQVCWSTVIKPSDQSCIIKYFYQNANAEYEENEDQRKTIAYARVETSVCNTIASDAKKWIPDGYDTPNVTGPTGNPFTITVQYPRKQYKIHYVSTALDDGTRRYGAAKGSLPTPTKQGYTFEGWYSDPDLNHAIDTDTWAAETMPAHDVYVYAKWSKAPVNPVTVNVYLTKEDIAGNNRLTLITTSKDSTAAPDSAVSGRSREGYRFAGWKYMVDDVETEFVFNSTPVSGDINVYGTWVSTSSEQQYSYTVRHVLYGSETPLADPTTGTAHKGETVTCSPDGMLTGLGYIPVQNTITKIITQPDEEIVFQYIDKQITVKFIPVVDGSQVDWKGNTVSKHVYSGGAHFADTLNSTATADDNYTFDGWYTDYTCDSDKAVPAAYIGEDGVTLQLPESLFTGDGNTFYFYAKFTSKGAALTITNNNGIDGHGYIFHITGGTVDRYVSIVGTGHVIVTRLPINTTYTVTQMTSWSYDSHANVTEVSVEIHDVEGPYSAAFSNSARTSNWLHGEVTGQF